MSAIAASSDTAPVLQDVAKLLVVAMFVYAVSAGSIVVYDGVMYGDCVGDPASGYVAELP